MTAGRRIVPGRWDRHGIARPDTECEMHCEVAPACANDEAPTVPWPPRAIPTDVCDLPDYDVTAELFTLRQRLVIAAVVVATVIGASALIPGPWWAHQ